MDEKNHKVQYLVAFAVSLTAVAASASYAWTTPVIPMLHNKQTSFNITDNEISWMAAMAAPGIMIGSLIARFVSDRFGRKPAVLASALPFLTGTGFAIFASKAWMLYLTRCLWGCAAGMINIVSSIYLVEIADKDIRGRLSAGNRFMFNFGGFLVITMGSFVTYDTLNYLLVALPISFFMVCLWIPETPYYLLKEGKAEEARKELSKLQGNKEDKVIEEQLSLMQSDVTREMSRSGSAKELFTGKQYRRAIIICFGLKVTQLMTGSIPIQQYLGRILQDSKIDMKVSTGLIIFGATKFLVGIMSSLVVDKIGRRPLFLYTFLAASASLTIVGAYFYYQEAIAINEESSRPFRLTIFIGIICFTIISTLGFDTLIYVVPAEIFPLNVKSVAMTSLNIFTAFITFVSVKAYQVIMDVSGLYGVFWFYASSALLGAIFTYFFVPETKGKSLRDIQIDLQGNLYEGSNVKLDKVVVNPLIEKTKNDSDESSCLKNES